MIKTKDCAQYLLEKTLNDKWKVVEKIKKEPNETGGNFSVGYIAIDTNGKKVFLKAFDFSKAFSGTVDAMKVLNHMTNAYDFEVKLMNKCVGSNLRYVVKLIDANQYIEDGFLYPVPYMVFEFAESSARKIINISAQIDAAWSLRSLHNIAVALYELHKVNIAHQDVKPSNVMIFNGKKTSKIGDVGRSSSLDMRIDHDDLICAGDISYSPWEQLYGWIDSDWEVRRYSCDMYMFGNLIYTYFNGLSINTSMLTRIKKEYRPKLLNGSYSGTYWDILPLLVHIFDRTLLEFNSDISDPLRSELISLVKQLSHPDYLNQRGDLKRNGAQRFSMERFITKLDLMASQYEYKLKKGLLE